MTGDTSPIVAMTPVARDPGRRPLRPAEAALLGERAVAKRRDEFAAGRLAARAAAGALLGLDAASEALAVVRDAGSGRPRLALHGRPLAAVGVSISHADGWAAAAACRQPVGLDLVTVEPLGTAFAAEAFAAGELDRWRAWLGDAWGLPMATAAAFAAKEAALKWLGIGLTVPLRSLVVSPSGPAAADSRASLALILLEADERGAATALPGWRLSASVDLGGRREVLDGWLLEIERRLVLVLSGQERAPG